MKEHFNKVYHILVMDILLGKNFICSLNPIITSFFLEVNRIIFYHYSSGSHNQQSLFNDNNDDNNKTRKRRDKIAYTITLAFILFSSTFLTAAVTFTVITASAQNAMTHPTPLVIA